MLLPQLEKLLGRSSLGSHNPVGKLLWEDFGVTGLSPKLFSKESISCSCCTQMLPQPRSLTRSLSCLCAALMPWTHSSPSCKVMGLKSQSHSASPASMGSPRSLSRRHKRAVWVSELSPLGQLPRCQPMALVPTPHPWGAHLPFCSCPCPSKFLT